jgi:DNA transformation protein
MPPAKPYRPNRSRGKGKLVEVAAEQSVEWTGGQDWRLIFAMSETAAALAFAVDLLSGLGRVEARRMFGGAGLYADGVMFGLIDDEVIYLKVDEALRADLAAAGARSWIYTERKGPKAGIPQETSYWSLPDSALDDPEEACAWGRRSLAIARALKAAKPVRGKRPRRGATPVAFGSS